MAKNPGGLAADFKIYYDHFCTSAPAYTNITIPIHQLWKEKEKTTVSISFQSDIIHLLMLYRELQLPWTKRP